MSEISEDGRTGEIARYTRMWTRRCEFPKRSPHLQRQGTPDRAHLAKWQTAEQVGNPTLGLSQPSSCFPIALANPFGHQSSLKSLEIMCPLTTSSSGGFHVKNKWRSLPNDNFPLGHLKYCLPPEDGACPGPAFGAAPSRAQSGRHKAPGGDRGTGPTRRASWRSRRDRMRR